VTATPAWHGPPLSRPFAGDVVGFVVRTEGSPDGRLRISGDTVFFPDLRDVAARMHVDTAIVHRGGVRFQSPARSAIR
jgi:L-ascorbate metabolism protein UlaG (beta-lactamase superfamily)